MLPFLDDARALSDDLLRVFGADRVEVLRFDESPLAGAGPGAPRTWSRDFTAVTGSCVVAVSDIGVASGRVDEWLVFARTVRRAGNHLVAFVPYGPDRWPRELARVMDLVHWDRTTTAGRAAAFVRRPGQPAARQHPRSVRELAQCCAFAVRIDPALTRAIRLDLLPQLDAGSEADLWASTLARFRGPDGVVLDPAKAAQLRRELSSDRESYDAAWEVTAKVHGRFAPTIRLQEELLFWSASPDTRAVPRTRELLRAAVRLVLENPAAVAWAVRLHAELPALPARLDESRMLGMAANLRQRDRLVETPDVPPGGLPESFGWLVPGEFPRVAIGVELYPGSLTLSEPPAAGAHVIDIADTRPLTLTVGRRRIDFDRESTRRVTLTRPDVRIRSADGTTWSLEPAYVNVVDRVLDRDPVISRAALEDAIHMPSAIPEVVNRLTGLSPAAIPTVRELLGQDPARSAPPMLERIFAADRNWHAATQVPSCLSPAHARFCERPLLDFLEPSWSEIDATRLSIEALGRIGAIDQAGRIARFLRDQLYAENLFDKYGGYCVEALARLLVASGDRSTAQRTYEPFADTVGLLTERGWPSLGLSPVQEIVSRSLGALADWIWLDALQSTNEDISVIAATAIGGAGGPAHADVLLETATDASRPERVRRSAIEASAFIGGAAVVDALAALDVGGRVAETRDFHLALCVGDAADDDTFHGLVERLLSRLAVEECWVYRAIGVRGDRSLLGLVREGLFNDDTAVRGDAALALARLVGEAAGGELRAAWDRVASTRERVLVALALLRIGEAPRGDPELHEFRRVLAEDSFQYRWPTQRDILDTLRAAGHPNARGIAAAWAPVYETRSAF